jgi:hypothetical protein
MRRLFRSLEEWEKDDVAAGSRPVTALGLKEDLTSGSCMSRERRELVLRGQMGWSVGPLWPRTGPVGQFLSYIYSHSFLIFCFMICFITLSFEIQMHSNKFLKFCKIQHSNMTQQETSFDDKN